MAEIHIERKKRSVVPWLLTGALLLAALWFFFARSGSEGVSAGNLGTDSSSRARDSALAVPPR